MANYLEQDERGLLTPDAAWREATLLLQDLAHQRRNPIDSDDVVQVQATSAVIQALVAYATGREETSAVFNLGEIELKEGPDGE